MTIHRILLVFWSLLATTFGGAITGLFFMGNPAVNSLYVWLSDAQTCIENYGTLTCDIHYYVGGRGFALLATGCTDFGVLLAANDSAFRRAIPRGLQAPPRCVCRRGAVHGRRCLCCRPSARVGRRLPL